LLVKNNQFTLVGGAAEVFSARGNEIGGVEGTHATIEDNDVNGTIADAVQVLAFAFDGGAPVAGSNPPILRALITGNTITGVGNLLPGAGGGCAFFGAAEDDADCDVTIDNNPQVEGGTEGGTNYQGAIVTQNQRGGDLDVVLTNNFFDNFPGAVNGPAVALFGNDPMGSVAETAIRFGGNNWNHQAGGFGETAVFAAGNGTMDVEGYLGGPVDPGALLDYLKSRDNDSLVGGIWTILSGHVTGDPADVQLPLEPVALTAAAGQAVEAGRFAQLTAEQLEPIVAAAKSKWLATDLTSAEAAMLDSARVGVADLGDGLLGDVFGSRIQVDFDAAGHGWFVDATPYDDSEFAAPSAVGLRAGDTSEAYERIDLLTVVMHELGHLLGHDHDDEEGLMGDTLATGRRYDLAVDYALEAMFDEGAEERDDWGVSQ
jgi:hypothetical protein